MANHFIQSLFNKRGILFNLLFFVYLLTLQPYLLRRVSWVIAREQTDPALGWLIIFVSILETLMIFWKTPAVAHRLQTAKSTGQKEDLGFGFLFLGWIFHTVVAVSLMMIAFSAFGMWSPSQAETFNPWAGGIIFVLVIKELIILFYWIAQLIPDKNKKTASEITPKIVRREILADIGLFIFAVVAFTCNWEFIASNTPIEGGNLIYTLVQYGIAGLICLIFFLPVRLLYLFEEFVQQRRWWETMLFWSSIFINILFNLMLIPFSS